MAEITVLPAPTNPAWRDIATGKINKPWELLALKIMLTRLRNELRTDSSPPNTEKCAQEVRAFFVKNLRVAQRDLRQIFS